MSAEMTAKLIERRQGHADLWDCTVDEFIQKVIPEVQSQQLKHTIGMKVVKTACSFLRIKFDRKELKGTVEYEVANAIQESLIYYANCLGEEV